MTNKEKAQRYDEIVQIIKDNTFDNMRDGGTTVREIAILIDKVIEKS